MRRLARLLVPVLALVPLTAGCNGKHAAYRDAASEGQYILAGGLKYQIQLSRELNPALPEDRAYLQDLGPGVAQPGGSREWFGIWMRVENDGSGAHRAASDFDITDSLGNTYTPVTIKPANILSYQPALLEPTDIYPNSQTAAARGGPRTGAMILFQLGTSVYQNRPLTLHIRAPGGDEARVELDLVNEDRPWLGDEPTGRVDPTFRPGPTGLGVFFAVAAPIVFASLVRSGGTYWPLFVGGIAIGVVVGVVAYFVMAARDGRGPRSPL